MLHITVKYKDRFTNGKWNIQHCVADSIEECIKIYGLEKDCDEYDIVEIISEECEANNRFLQSNHKINNCIYCRHYCYCDEIHTNKFGNIEKMK